MSQQPSTFGQASNPVRPPIPAPDTTTGRRSVVLLSVAGAVVALGVLGGAAALVLGGEPDDLGPVAAPVTPVIEPSVEAVPEPVTALPTAAVQGRNIFVPLVSDAGQDGAQAPDAVQDTSGDDPGTSADAPEGTGAGTQTGSSTSTSAGAAGSAALKSRAGTGTSLVVSAVTAEVSAVQTELAKRDAEIASLRTALTDLNTLASDEVRQLQERLASVEAERKTLDVTLAELRAELAALPQYDLVFLGVEAGPAAESYVLTVELNGEELTVDEGETFDRSDRGALPDRFTFYSYDETTQTVSLGFVSTTYTIDVSRDEPVRLGLG